MKWTIILLMMVGLMVGIVGCGDDDNPVNSDIDRLAGTWIDQENYEVAFKLDGTYVYTGVDYIEEGTWSLEGDELTLFNDKDGEDGYTYFGSPEESKRVRGIAADAYSTYASLQLLLAAIQKKTLYHC